MRIVGYCRVATSDQLGGAATGKERRFPSRTEVEELRLMYPVGTRIRLIHMDDPYTHLRPGDMGTVQYVDDAGQIHMSWDYRSSLALIPSVDQFEKV